MSSLEPSAPDPSSVLDLLVVGGGPGGTATAFRAKELGLAVLVIEHDDLMKRIRDYSKDKLILPTFGGGDRMSFPSGGEMVASLCFEPIDKDDMCAAWKGFYERYQVPARSGLELTGVEEEGDLWRVHTWDQLAQSSVVLRARHVAIAIGRGVPRRFDIPGNTEDIPLRLLDAEAYVGAPACVIGGGTSAAEAVVAISNAKAAAGDATEVYWSYRGDKMPRVSKQLSAAFFEAFLGNGNVRYVRRSEPLAVLTGDDRVERLAIRVDCRTVEGRPIETTLLEFPKQAVVACIGEDLPTGLLASCGIAAVPGGRSGRPRFVVNRFLESCRPRLYLVGDVLSQAYYRCRSFDDPPDQLEEVKHRGNIKSALADGVRVAEVVRQRLDGRADAEIEVAEPAPSGSDSELAAILELSGVHATAGEADSSDGSPSKIAASSPPTLKISRPTVPVDVPPRASVAPQATRLGEPRLIQLLRGGVQGDEHALRVDGPSTLGGRGCTVDLSADDRVAPLHASIVPSARGYRLRDEGSAGGTLLQVPSTRKLDLAEGDLLVLGRQLLLLAYEHGRPRLLQFDPSGRELGRHDIPQRTMVIGREAPDLILDPNDAGLSRRHLALASDGRTVQAHDLASTNGTWLRVRGEVALDHGDRFRIGAQHFAFSLRRDAVLDTAPAPAPSARLPSPPREIGGPAGPRVTFRPAGVTLAARRGETVCGLAEANGVRITAECHAGLCGSDPVRILSGREHLAPPGDAERETLEEICGLEPGPYRLACQLRVSEPVEVEVEILGS